MESGKMMSAKVMVHIIIPTEIDTKDNGIEIFKTVLELITMQMEIYIRGNGWMESSMAKEIIYTTKIMPFTKEIGNKVKNKDLDNW